MTSPIKVLRARAAARLGDGPMLLVLFALVFVPVAGVHAAFALASPAATAEGAVAPRP